MNYRLLEKGEERKADDLVPRWGRLIPIRDLEPAIRGEVLILRVIPEPTPDWHEIGKQEPDTWPVEVLKFLPKGGTYMQSCDDKKDWEDISEEYTHWRPLTLPEVKPEWEKAWESSCTFKHFEQIKEKFGTATMTEIKEAWKRDFEAGRTKG